MLDELQLKILKELLRHNSRGLKARELSNILCCTKSFINHFLYSTSINKFIKRDYNYKWFILTDKIDEVRELLDVSYSNNDLSEMPNLFTVSGMNDSVESDNSSNDNKDSSCANDEIDLDNEDDEFVEYDDDNDPDETQDECDDEETEDENPEDEEDDDENPEDEDDDDDDDEEECEDYSNLSDEWLHTFIKKKSLRNASKTTSSSKFENGLLKSTSLFSVFKNYFLSDDFRAYVDRFDNSASFMFSASNGFKGYGEIRNNECVLAGLTAFADFWDEVQNVGYSANSCGMNLFNELVRWESEDSTYSQSVRKRRNDYYLADSAKTLVATYLNEFDRLVSFEDIFAYISTFSIYRRIDKYLLRKVLREDENFVSPDGVISFQLSNKSIFSGSVLNAVKTVLEKEGQPLHISELTTKVLNLRPDTIRKNIYSRIYHEIQEGNLCSFENSFVGLKGVNYPLEYVENDGINYLSVNEEKFRRNLSDYKKFIEENNHIPFSLDYDEQQSFLYNWYYRVSHNLDLPIHLKTELYLVQQNIINNHIAASVDEYDFFDCCNNYKVLLMKYGRMIDNGISEKYSKWFNNSLKSYKARTENIRFYFEELLELLCDFGYSF